MFKKVGDLQPISIVHIGTDKIKPLNTPAHTDLEAWKKTFENAQKDPDFKINVIPVENEKLEN